MTLRARAVRKSFRDVDEFRPALFNTTAIIPGAGNRRDGVGRQDRGRGGAWPV